MNYFLEITSKPNYPLVFDAKANSINGSFLAIGKFIQNVDEIKVPLIYNDANNSDLEYEKLIEYNVLQTVGGGYLYSQSFVDFLYKNDFAKDVQIFKTRFTYKGQVCEQYYAINIYNKIECYDMKNSVYTIHPVDKSYKFTKRVLKECALEEYGYVYNMVRDIYDNRIIVSAAFRDLMAKEKFNSFKLTKK